MAIQFVKTTGQHQAGFFDPPTPIPGLSLMLPQAVGEDALIILNVPAPFVYSAGPSPQQPGNGGWFGISIDGKTLPEVATFINGAPIVWPNFTRVPTTLVVAVPMTTKTQKVVALWKGIGGPLIIDSPASLAAIT